MNWENIVVKLNVKTNNIDFNNPLNLYSIYNSSGTGFFITKNLILTCYHVVKYAKNIEIVYKQTNFFEGKIKYIFPNDDLALIELNQCINDIIILDFKIIKSKKEINEVYTIGFPLGSDNIISTKGIISGFRQSKIQTDAALNPGNSGGPLVVHDSKLDKWYFIGINVSKITASQKTGFCIPVYRFLLIKNYIEKYNITDIIINKPTWNFDYQNIKQSELAKEVFINYPEYQLKKIGIRITLINKLSYLYKYFNPNDILLSINNNYIDFNGFIKFDFFPDNISIHEIGLWFIMNDILEIKILKYNSINNQYKLEVINIELNYFNKNLLDYYLLDNLPKYYIENNNLILSIITKDHIEDMSDLNLSTEQIIKLASRYLNKQDIFTVYLSGVKPEIYTKFNKYPIGEIIIEINDLLFNNYNEFINITKMPITKIKTIDNKIFYV